MNVETSSPDDPHAAGVVRLLSWYGDDGHGTTTDPDSMRRMLSEAGRLYWSEGASFGIPAASHHLGLDLSTKSVDVNGLDLVVRPQQRKQQFGLDALARHYLGEGKAKPDIEDLADVFGGVDRIPLDDECYHAYALRDAELTWRIAKVIDAGDYFDVEKAVTGLTAILNTNGLPVDLVEAQKQADEADAQREALYPQFAALGLPDQGRPWATRAAQEWIATLPDSVKWPRTDGSRTYAVGEKVLAQIVDPGSDIHVPGAEALIIPTLKMLALKDMFPKQVLKHQRDGVIHPEFRADSVNGRWSAKEPNILGVGKHSPELLQQRACVIAPTSMVLIGADLKSIDSRSMAGLSGDKAYLADVEQDLNTVVAETLGISRNAAKALNYGIPYGRQAKAIAADLKIPEGEAQEMLDNFTTLYPDLTQWITDQIAIAQTGEPLDNGHGRKVTTVMGNEGTQAAARAAASCTRDLLVKGLARDTGLWPSLFLIIHDEVILAVAPGTEEEMANRLVAALTWTWDSPSGLSVPILPDPWNGVSATNWSGLYAREGT